MEQIEVILESKGSVDSWSEVLKLFGDLEETERRRYSWVTPTVADLKWLKDIFANYKVDRLIGVGCGSGFLERVISDYCGELFCEILCKYSIIQLFPRSTGYWNRIGCWLVDVQVSSYDIHTD